MALENADLETDLFYADGPMVYRRGVVEVSDVTNGPNVLREQDEELICRVEPGVEGGAEQIARALNRLPKLERFLIDVAGAIREGDEKRLNGLADEIEELIVNG